jgi:mannose-6-phosphate isomerase-like protein (cupin superfamily)
LIQEIIDAKKSKSPALFKNILPSVPKWENFISHLNSQYHNTEVKYQALNTNREKFINGVLFKDPFYVNITDPTVEFYPEINLFFKEFEFLGEGKPLSAYVNFAKEPPSTPHVDSKDHFYWQCVGTTVWEFKDVTYVLSPGDVIYIPNHTQHNVITTEPRAAIQFEYKLNFNKLQDAL